MQGGLGALEPLFPLRQQALEVYFQQFHGERFGDVQVCARFVSLYLALYIVLRRKQYQRDVGYGQIVLDAAAHLYAVHFGHHHITDNDVGEDGHAHFQSDASVIGYADVVGR